MSEASESAEQVVRIALEGTEVVAKITGEASKNIAVLLVNALKTQEQTKGKARLSSMIKSGKELKVFTIKKQDYNVFAKQAKNYGVLYSAILQKRGNQIDEEIDVMVRSEDASKINRIVEKFNLGRPDNVANLRTEIVKNIEKNKKNNDKAEITKTQRQKELDNLLKKPIEAEKQENEIPSNSSTTVGKTQLENLSNTKENMEIPNKKRKSIRKELEKIKSEEKQRGKAKEKTNVKSPNRNIKYKKNKGRE